MTATIMTRIPAAIVQVAAVYLNCPHCGEGFQNTEDGSMLVSMHNFRPEQIGTVVTCYACNGTYRIPARAKVVFA